MTSRATSRPAAFWPWLVFAAGLLLAGGLLRHCNDDAPAPPAPAAGESAGDTPEEAVPSPAFAPDQCIVYRAEEGDTIASVARIFGLGPAFLAEANGLHPHAPLQPGQSILIPPSPAH